MVSNLSKYVKSLEGQKNKLFTKKGCLVTTLAVVAVSALALNVLELALD